MLKFQSTKRVVHTDLLLNSLGITGLLGQDDHDDDCIHNAVVAIR